jgi:hypothetical protein
MIWQRVLEVHEQRRVLPLEVAQLCVLVLMSHHLADFFMTVTVAVRVVVAAGAS